MPSCQLGTKACHPRIKSGGGGGVEGTGGGGGGLQAGKDSKPFGGRFFWGK